ncbi:MAG: pyridoxal-phosphate dependent enzyme [Bacteroidetes bacterium]|nr:pyridoxal-phosphate dependent enzyme [Bacteroidota bacterium]
MKTTIHSLPVSFDDILSAQKRIQHHILKTPVKSSPELNKLFNGQFFFKCENLQKAGAFKMRGAANAVFSLTDEEAKSGVATHSSGNHAAALSLAASLRGIPAFVVMPETAPKPKIENVNSFGGKITFCPPTQKDREETLARLVKETSAVPVHPSNDVRVIAGQGTAALEFLKEITELDFILTPVGGGGLLAGTALAAKSIKPGIRVIGVEPETVNDAFLSFSTGTLHPPTGGKSIADGLLTSLGTHNFPIIQTYVDEILTVSEASILEALKILVHHLKQDIEPSSAVPFAAFLEGKIKADGRKIGIILSGGNVDKSKFPEIWG